MEAEADAAIQALKLIVASEFWPVPVIEEITCESGIWLLHKLGVDVKLYMEDPDKVVTINDRDPRRDGQYIINFLRTVEPDEQNDGLSADVLAHNKLTGITLAECLMLSSGYFMATGCPMNCAHATLCTGSRSENDRTPGVAWDSNRGRVYIKLYRTDTTDSGFLRARTAHCLVAHRLPVNQA